MINLKKEEYDNLVIMGDRVLIKPKFPQEKTQSGLFLPPSVVENEKVALGYVVKIGPGYPIPSSDYDEPWKEKKPQYIAIQPKVGDLAIYTRTGAIEIKFNNETYFIVKEQNVLMSVRDENLMK